MQAEDVRCTSLSPFFFPSSPSLSLSSEDDEEEDDDEEEPDEHDDEEEEELEPECDEEEEDEDEEEEERDEELEEDPSDSEPRLASLRPLLLGFLGFLSEELGVRGLVRAATICCSPSFTSGTGFSSSPVGVAGGGGLHLSPCFSLPSSPSDAGSTLGTILQGSASLWAGGGSGEPVNIKLETWL